MKRLAAALALLVFAPTLAFAQDALKLQTEKHKKNVTRMRGLEFKNEVNVGVYSKEDLQEFILAEFKKEMPKEWCEKKGKRGGRRERRAWWAPLRRAAVELRGKQ